MKVERHHFETIESTNLWARQHLHEFPKDMLTLVTASEQTAGKGRLGNTWYSPHDQNIYATFCLFQPKNSVFRNITQVMALAAKDALEAGCGMSCQLKWPNDLLFNRKKIGGILCEVISLENSCAALVGIGLNVNLPEIDTTNIDQPATSVYIETGNLQNIEKLLALIQQHFCSDLDNLLKNGFYPFLDSYKKALTHKSGEYLRIKNNANAVEGLFHSIDTDGSLLLKLPDGTVKRFSSGDVVS